MNSSISSVARLDEEIEMLIPRIREILEKEGSMNRGELVNRVAQENFCYRDPVKVAIAKMGLVEVPENNSLLRLPNN